MQRTYRSVKMTHRSSGSLTAITTTLNTRFGCSAFRPGQAEAIRNLLAGRHMLVVMPTGAGKSLIYQLASFYRPGVTLVISPLIALMQDQVDSLTGRGIPATYINSTLPAREQNRRLQALAAGDFRLVYVAPERLRSVRFQEILHQVEVGLLAVDEAHCISQWGHDFRPDYRHIAEARPMMGDPVTVALTATATPLVQDDIVRALRLTPVHRIVTGFNRPNLFFAVRHTPDPVAKRSALRDLLRNWTEGAAIVYVGTRRDAEEVATFLRDVVHLEAAHYHAGLDSNERNRRQEMFLEGRQPVIVATNAFGMGIDRPDVRLVVHHTMPGTVEAYYQEAGRAGRDGRPAQAVLLYAPRDRALHEWFITTSTSTQAQLRALHNSLPAGGGPVWATIADLSSGSGLPLAKVKACLAQLEAAGVLERLGDKGRRMLLRRGEWDESTVEIAFADAERYRRHRQTQLAQVIAYAESNTCRRRILLDHFGDQEAAEANRCCDNCLAGGQSEIHQIILACVRSLTGRLPRSGVAKLLVGSSSRRVAAFRTHPHYGRLANFTRSAITRYVDALIGRGDLVLDEHRKVIVAQPNEFAPELPARDRAQRVYQLGELGVPSAVPELIAALQDPSGDVRRLAASALGKIGDARAVTPLLALLAQEQKPQVRQYAAKALGRIGDPRARSALQRIAGDENERDYTRKSARNALYRLERHT
jgi:ATP-dependent DNA helicase RecQ